MNWALPVADDVYVKKKYVKNSFINAENDGERCE